MKTSIFPENELTTIKRTGAKYWYYEFRCNDVLRDHLSKYWECVNSNFVTNLQFVFSLLDLKLPLGDIEMFRLRLTDKNLLIHFTRLFGRVQMTIYPL